MSRSGLFRVFNHQPKLDDKFPEILEPAPRKLNFGIFKKKLYEFGIQGVSDEDILKMFKKYDIINLGYVEYDVFVKAITSSYLQRNKLTVESIGDLKDQMSQGKALSNDQINHRHYQNFILRVKLDSK